MKKTYIFIVAIALIYLGLMYFFFIKPKPTVRPTSGELKILLHPNTRWHYDGKNWLRKTTLSQYDNKEYELYIDQEYKGDYELGYIDNQWYYYPEPNCTATDINCGGESLFNKNFIAISGNREVDVKKYDIIDVDKSEISPYYNNIGIVESERMKIQKISMDFDNDKKEEKLYIVSNVFMMNDHAQKYYSVLFMVDEKDIIILYKNITDVETENCDITVSNILDISKNKKYSIISRCIYNDMKGSCHELYELRNGKYVTVKKCEQPTM